ncbi:hypothetical protein BC937DRAFT_94794 [Endogone sp. FLAS-F59071]|nr:hypothetical protein BC937DRAFT_94794 [Endogone sp. FLAS-F59071]|eukprot:RUS22940.1 hypothetical protein BC937DRAFT_94794 [Endogone sp. FLAS-F59071]
MSRTTQSTDLIPIELFSYILIHLDSGSVYQCTLLNRRFSQSAIPHLWKALQPSSLRSWQGIINTLSLSSSFDDYGQHVKHVNFSALPAWEAQQVTDAMVEILLTRCQSLRGLYFTRLQRLSTLSLVHIANFHTDTLETLDLSACSQFSGAELHSLFMDPNATTPDSPTPSSLSSISFLSSTPNSSLSSNIIITTTTTTDFQVVPRRFSQLTTLNLSSCSHGVSDALILAIARASPHLRHLYLHRSGNVSDVALVSLAHYCPNLETLHITLPEGFIQSNKITDVAIRALAQGCKRLRVVVVRGQTRITAAVEAALVRECWSLEKVDFSLELPAGLVG